MKPIFSAQNTPPGIGGTASGQVDHESFFTAHRRYRRQTWWLSFFCFLATCLQAAPGLVHYYFGGKDALLVEALQAAGRQFHRRMEHLIQQVPAEQSLDVFLIQLSERVEQESEVYRLRYESFSPGLHNPVIAPAVRERLAQRREEIGSVMATVMEKMGQTEGVERSPLDPMALAALLLALFDGLALQKIMDPGFDLDAAYHLLAQLLRGLLGS